MGDWDKHFALLAVGHERSGSETKLRENAIVHLFEVYVSINKDASEEEEESSASSPPCFDCVNEHAKEIFKKMEEGDEETLAM